MFLHGFILDRVYKGVFPYTNGKMRELIKSYEILIKDINVTSLAVYQGFVLPFSKQNHSVSIRSINVFQDDFIKNLFCCNCDGFIDGHFHGRFMKDYEYKLCFDCLCDCHKHCGCSRMIGTLLLGDIKLDGSTTFLMDKHPTHHKRTESHF